VVAGTLSSAPTRRDLPSGQHLMMFEITTRAAGQPTRSVPVVWLDGPDTARNWPAGSSVVAVGEVSRRFFRAGGATASRTEVVAAKVVRERGSARRRLLASLPAEVLSWAES
jgi:single-strand DNA-binding protein